MAATQDVVGDLFDKAYKLNEEKEQLIEQRAAVRDSLRNLATAGVLTDAQVKEVDELFPPRKRGENGSEPDDNVVE